MSHDHLVAIGALLRERMNRDPELRKLVAQVGAWLVELTGEAESVPATAPERPADEPPVEATVDGPARTHAAPPPPAPAPPRDPVPSEKLERLIAKYRGPEAVASEPLAIPPARPVETRATETSARPSVQELEPVARRIELKADACAWAARRHDNNLAGGDFAPLKPEYDHLRARADTVQPCFLWMIHQDAQFIGREDLARLEGCYRACAEALRTILEFPEAYESGPDLLRLLGEAQSAIRAGMAACGAHPRWQDGEQQALFAWCKSEGEARRVFNQFLALDRLADPSLHAGLRARIGKLRDDLRARREAEKRRQHGLNTIRYHLARIRDDGPASDRDWQRIGDGIDEVLASAPPSLPELVELLSEAADELPESLLARRGVAQVLKFVDQRLAAEDETQAPPARRDPTTEMMRVREALRGTTVVLIGGTPRPHSRALLEREFELAELDWLDAREHQSLASFEPAIARERTSLVVVMIRWASHSFEDVQEICLRHGKPFVRLPGGYNPAQVAHQIMEQVSGQIGIG